MSFLHVPSNKPPTAAQPRDFDEYESSAALLRSTVPTAPDTYVHLVIDTVSQFILPTQQTLHDAATTSPSRAITHYSRPSKRHAIRYAVRYA